MKKSKLTAKKVLLTTAILSVAFFHTGCITVGKNFSSDSLSWITPGKTTRGDVHLKLGEPFRVGIDEQKLTWTYGYYKYRAFGSTCTKDLVFYFSKDSAVDSYTFNTSFPQEKENWLKRTEP